jgi:hypothetical protein
MFLDCNEKLDHVNDVDEMCEKFTKCFLKIAKECIPTKIVTIRNNDSHGLIAKYVHNIVEVFIIYRVSKRRNTVTPLI